MPFSEVSKRESYCLPASNSITTLGFQLILEALLSKMKNNSNMRYRIYACLVALFTLGLAQHSSAQEAEKTGVIEDIDLSLGAGDGSFLGSLAYQNTWALGKNDQWRLSYGLRFTLFSGKDMEFYSAPIDYYLIEENTDTLQVANPGQSNLALYIGASYVIKNKLELGFNIDALGYTFGGETEATFLGNNQKLTTTVNPNQPTLLLVGANDRGMIKAEFFVGYQLNENWAARIGFNNNFVEYKTATELQKGNTRFRGDPTAPFLAVRYRF